jgi:hypothetical protein
MKLVNYCVCDRWEDNYDGSQRRRMGLDGLDSSGGRYEPVEGSYMSGKESPGIIKLWEFLE